jgi:5-methyltetrahydropteroyltriglutamate--homocysteine methyltransferase
MQRSTRRILTTHTGALHRPADLEELFRKKYAGEAFDAAAFEARLRSGVAEIVRKQIDVGIDSVDDGEYSKLSFWAYIMGRVRGVERRPIKAQGSDRFFKRAAQNAAAASDRERFAEFYADTEPPGGVTTPPSLVQLYLPVGMAFDPPASYAVVGPLEYDPSEVRRDIDNLTLAVLGANVSHAFMPVVSPAMFATRFVNEHYGSDEEYYAAVADVLREEYRAIVDAGLVVQLDDVSLPGRYRLLAAQGKADDFAKWSGLAVEALNHALRGIPEESVRYHLCWGSMNAPHTDDPALEDIIGPMLGIKAQAYQIEAANARHEHEYHVWEKTRLPEGKILMPGVIGHATNVVEHPEVVAERILRFAKVVGRENVIAATDCGFRGRTHPQIAWAKLEALVEGARRASRRLFN